MTISGRSTGDPYAQYFQGLIDDVQILITPAAARSHRHEHTDQYLYRAAVTVKVGAVTGKIGPGVTG